MKVTSKRIAALAGKYLNMEYEGFYHAELVDTFADIKALAACVLSQTESKPQPTKKPAAKKVKR